MGPIEAIYGRAGPSGSFWTWGVNHLNVDFPEKVLCRPDRQYLAPVGPIARFFLGLSDNTFGLLFPKEVFHGPEWG